jgi:hypothetical protein
MADRSVPSVTEADAGADAGLAADAGVSADAVFAGFVTSSKCAGMLVGDVISATVPWVKESPVIAPHVLRLTSAVACCQVGFLTGCTESPTSTAARGMSFPAEWFMRLFRNRYPARGKVCRMACTWGLPGSFAFSKSTLMFLAALAVAPTTHS